MEESTKARENGGRYALMTAENAAAAVGRAANAAALDWKARLAFRCVNVIVWAFASH